MSFLDFAFLAFFVIFFVIYYLLPQKYRYLAILVGSLIFYGKSNYKLAILLCIISCITYLSGLIIDRVRSKIAYICLFSLNILILIVFKYTDFMVVNLNKIFTMFNLKIAIDTDGLNLLLPVGLSFIIFQSCTYLFDVYHENISVEKNLFKVIAFIAFFPTVLSGPIQKARNLLPQISHPREFEFDNARKGIVLFIWGAFQKIMVANRLAIIYKTIYADLDSYNPAYCLLAAISFSLYIYADFSSYSDMARGVAKLLGIDVGKNFNNPYMSLTTAEFWNRWHMSLNSWLLENVYIPLGGNRKGIFRKYINVMAVFVISGLWHGAENHYLLWGTLNGILVVLSNMVRPIKKKLIDRFKADSDVITKIQQIITFACITITWIPFTNGIHDSKAIVKKIFSLHIIDFYTPNIFSICGTVGATFLTIIAVCAFIYIQMKRTDETICYVKFKAHSVGIQCLCLAVVVLICVLGSFSADTGVDSQFMYFQF